MIEIQPIPLNERQTLSRKDVNKCAPNANFEQLRMFNVANDGHKIEHIKDVIFDNSSLANFFIVLEVNNFNKSYLDFNFS